MQAVRAQSSPLTLALTTFALVLPMWMGVIDLSIANVGFGIIAGALNVTVDEIAWISTSYVLAMMMSTLLSGWFAVRLGRKRGFLIMVALFTVSSLGCALSSSLALLVVMRFAQGFGAGAMTTLASATLLEVYPKERHADALRIFGLAVMLGPILGPTLGGWMLANLPWQFAFLVNVPFGAGALAMGLSFLPEHAGTPRKRSFDWGSLALMFSALYTFVYVLQEGARDDWFASPLIAGTSVLSLVLFVGFVYVQVTSRAPLVDLTFLRIRSYVVSIGLAVVSGIGLTGTGFIVPLYFEDVLGFDAQAAGMAMLPGAFASVLGLQLGGALQKRTSPYAILAIALVCLATGTIWFAFLGKAVGFDQTFVPRVLQGIGMGLFVLPFNLLAVQDVPKGHYDRSQSLIIVSRQLGIVLGYAVLSALLVHLQTMAAVAFFRRIDPARLSPATGLAPIRYWLLAHGSSPAQADANARLVFERMAAHAALSISYSETFFVLAMLFVVSIPCVLLLIKWRGEASSA